MKTYRLKQWYPGLPEGWKEFEKWANIILHKWIVDQRRELEQKLWEGSKS